LIVLIEANLSVILPVHKMVFGDRMCRLETGTSPARRLKTRSSSWQMIIPQGLKEDRMIDNRMHYTILALLAPLVAVWSPTSAAEPASRPALRAIPGRVVSLDPSSGDLVLAWKHPRQREMEIQVKLAPDVRVVENGKPAALSDVKPGRSVRVLGKAQGVDRENRFVVSEIELVSAGPATRPSAGDPQVDGILERLERKGDQIEDIETPIRFTKIDPVLEDKQVFEGILRFKKDQPNPRFFIRFDKFTQEGVTREKREWHVFDGQWYIEAREKTNTIVKRQVVRPGEEVDVFRIGQGPFPLPFGQKKAEILKYFDCKRVAPDAKDPPNTVHLGCTPKPDTDMAKKHGSVHFYIDRSLDLPVKVRTVEKSENVEVSAEFPADKIRINTGMAASQLNLPPLPDYQVDTVPLGQ